MANATATLRGAVDATVDAVEHGRDATAGAASNAVAEIDHDALRSDMSKYKDEIVSAVSTAMSSVKKSAGSVGDNLGDVYGQVRDRSSAYADDALRYTRSHPMTVAAIAAGVGVLLAALLLRRR